MPDNNPISVRRQALWGKVYVRGTDHSAWPWYVLEYSLLLGFLLDTDKYLEADQNPWLAYSSSYTDMSVLSLLNTVRISDINRIVDETHRTLSSETKHINVLQNSTSSRTLNRLSLENWHMFFSWPFPSNASWVLRDPWFTTVSVPRISPLGIDSHGSMDTHVAN